MVFHGEKIQKVKFDDKENSHFANVNITGAEIEEEPESLFVMTWRTIKSVGEGIEEALTEVKESLDSPEELATMAGITVYTII